MKMSSESRMAVTLLMTLFLCGGACQPKTVVRPQPKRITTLVPPTPFEWSPTEKKLFLQKLQDLKPGSDIDTVVDHLKWPYSQEVDSRKEDDEPRGSIITYYLKKVDDGSNEKLDQYISLYLDNSGHLQSIGTNIQGLKAGTIHVNTTAKITLEELSSVSSDYPALPNAKGKAANDPKVVKAGFGLPQCHLGMPIKDLQGEWKELSDPDLGADIVKSYLDNHKEGLQVAHDRIHVRGIFVYFHETDFEQFAGIIEGGIDAKSSIEDVIFKKGQPAHIAVTRNDEGEWVDLWFMEEGISFTFLNKLLSDVRISPPMKDPSAQLKEDIGDTSYYRSIKTATP